MGVPEFLGAKGEWFSSAAVWICLSELAKKGFVMDYDAKLALGWDVLATGFSPSRFSMRRVFKADSRALPKIPCCISYVSYSMSV